MDLGKALQKSIDLYLKNFGVLFLAGLVVAILSMVTIGILAGPLVGGFILLIQKLIGEKKQNLMRFLPISTSLSPLYWLQLFV